MKTLTVLLLLLSTIFLAGCGQEHQQAHQHRYQIERVKDVAGNDAFLRIDLDTGEECAIGHGWAVVRPSSGSPNPYRVEFCHSAETKAHDEAIARGE